VPHCTVKIQAVILCKVDGSDDDDKVKYNDNQRYVIHLGFKNNHSEWVGEDYKDHPCYKYLVSPLLFHALMRLNFILNQYTKKVKKDAAGNVIKEVITCKNMTFGRRLIPEIKIIW
jgi:hypothetical protein